MFQELLGGNASTGIVVEKKIPVPSNTPILTSTTTSTLTATTKSSTIFANSSNWPNSGNNNNNSNNNNSDTNSTQNLRCPRCDSTNTKFCYYNNYNLTQPRHFCKTCRRYWTKGGTLRNVPIGGGCRKNKTTTNGSSSNAMAKAKATISTQMLFKGNPGFLGNGSWLDHLHHHPEAQLAGPNPSLWPSFAQNPHIFALVRGSSQFPNPNPSPTFGLDSHTNGAPYVLGSFPRSIQLHQVSGFESGAPDFFQNNGNMSSNILELYQRLKSSSNYSYCGNENPGVVSVANMIGSTSSSSAHAGGEGDNLGGYSLHEFCNFQLA